MKLIYEPPAQRELVEATRYYSDVSLEVATDLYWRSMTRWGASLNGRAWPPVGQVVDSDDRLSVSIGL